MTTWQGIGGTILFREFDPNQIMEGGYAFLHGPKGMSAEDFQDHELSNM